jgi:hypothetical protein
MTGPMPTHDGDVVVSHNGAKMQLCAVWTVASDFQQTPSPDAFLCSALGFEAALRLGALIVRERQRGTLFLFDNDSLTWTNPAD